VDPNVIFIRQFAAAPLLCSMPILIVFLFKMAPFTSCSEPVRDFFPCYPRVLLFFPDAFIDPTLALFTVLLHLWANVPYSQPPTSLCPFPHRAKVSVPQRPRLDGAHGPPISRPRLSAFFCVSLRYTPILYFEAATCLHFFLESRSRLYLGRPWPSTQNPAGSPFLSLTSFPRSSHSLTTLPSIPYFDARLDLDRFC